MILTKIATNEEGQRFDKYLKKLLKDAPDSFIYKMLRKKNITLNGKKADGKEILYLNDEVKLFLADETFEKFGGKSMDYHSDIAPYERAYQKMNGLRILYEDDNILIVDKPAGILSQKSKQEDISVNEWLTGYLLFRKCITAEMLSRFKPSVCERLDRNTSGIVICGKTLAGSQYLSSIIKDKSLEKYYYCIVSGAANINGHITGYLYKDTAQNKVTVFSRERDVPASLKHKAEYIDTVFRAIHTFPEMTFMEVQLFTGKTHQIRAHLASLGHPIIGDGKYGSAAVNQEYAKKGVHGQMLHAHKLVFPSTQNQVFEQTSGMVVECPVPDIFNRLMGEG